MKRFVVTALAVFVVMGFLPLAIVAMFGAPSVAVAPITCSITGTVGKLTSAQSDVIEAIAGRAELVGEPQLATEIGVDVSLALTKLNNEPPSATEVGPFAFDPNGNWGPSDVLDNVNEDVVLFMAALLNDPTWDTATIPNVAASVMATNGVLVKAMPKVFSTALTKAKKYTNDVVALASSQNTCGSADAATLVGVGSGALPANYQIPATATPQEAQAVGAAISQIGNIYVWGGASVAGGFDCSGLTMWAWAQADPPFLLDHYTVSQWEETVALTSLVGASPGDIVLVPGSDGTLNPPNPQHVGMYIGDVNGVPWVVDAADQQLGVIAQTYSSFIAGGLIAVGHIVDGSSS